MCAKRSCSVDATDSIRLGTRLGSWATCDLEPNSILASGSALPFDFAYIDIVIPRWLN